MNECYPQIVLASASPRRRELLTQLGLDIAVVPSRAAELFQTGETPAQHAERLSRDKAREVASRAGQPGRWFVGSDTIVVLDDRILGKPLDAADAKSMLGRLAGREHCVISGYAVLDRQTDHMVSGIVITRVFFKPLTAREIEGYIATGEPFDKAGSYAIQGIGAFMVPRIEGSYSNVVGLPLCEVMAALEGLGAVELFAVGSE